MDVFFLKHGVLCMSIQLLLQNQINIIIIIIIIIIITVVSGWSILPLNQSKYRLCNTERDWLRIEEISWYSTFACFSSGYC